MTVYINGIRRTDGLGRVSFSSMLGVAVFLLIGREMAAGAARYYFDQIGLGVLWFVPDLMIFGLLFLRITDLLLRRAPFPAPIVWFLTGISIPTVLGLLIYKNPIAIGSGIKLLIPVIAMIIIPPRFLNSKSWLQACFLMLVVSIIGIIANQFTSYPWEGYVIKQFGVERSAVRVWWLEGESRYAGLSAVSASGAAITMLMALLITRKIKSVFFRALIYAATIYACDVTTSRTTMIAMVLAAGVDLWPWRTFRGIGPGKNTLTIVSCLSFFLPAALALVLIAVGASTSSIYHGMNSFLMRIVFTWPSVLNMVYDNGLLLALTGHGFGSIGTPARYTGSYISPESAVDNLFLYLFYVYGLFSFAIVGFVLICFRKLSAADRPLAFAAVTLAATMSSEGVPSLLPFVIAVAIGFYFSKNPSVRKNGSLQTSNVSPRPLE